MPEPLFRVGPFLKLLMIALAFGIGALFLNVQIGISFQAIQVGVVVFLFIVATINFMKHRALRPRPMKARERQLRELQAMEELQLDAVLENKRPKEEPTP